MSEIQHPPIDTSITRELSPEREFAEQAYEILNTYQIQCAKIIGNQEVVYPVTDLVETASLDPTVRTAVRLVRHPVYAFPRQPDAVPESGTNLKTSDESEDFVVIELQHGTVNDEDVDEDELLIDEDYDWHPYVTVITSRYGEVSVLDKQTGKELSAGDLAHAHFVMQILHSYLRGLVCESALQIDDMPVEYMSLETTYKEFPAGEALDLNYACNQCGRVNTPCGHNNSQMN